LAIVVPESGNKKVGLVAATYAPVKISCPTSCAFLNNGCYAQGGNTNLHNRRIEQASEGATALEVAKAEALGIDQLSGDLPLRLHVSGDAKTEAAVRVLADAAARYILRGGQPVWTYTHAHRDVSPEAWGAVSVLASVESVEDALDALARGWAPALVVKEHPADGKAYRVGELKVIPCPEQTRGIACVDCGLCMDNQKLINLNAAIGFAAHGAGTKRVKEAVE
jgi:hypothetical protein